MTIATQKDKRDYYSEQDKTNQTKKNTNYEYKLHTNKQYKQHLFKILD